MDPISIGEGGDAGKSGVSDNDVYAHMIIVEGWCWSVCPCMCELVRSCAGLCGLVRDCAGLCGLARAGAGLLTIVADRACECSLHCLCEMARVTD